MTSRPAPAPRDVPAHLKAVFDHIDENFEQHVERLQEWIRVKGISNTGEGMDNAADYVVKLFNDLGCQDVRRVEVGTTEWGAEAHPVIYGRYDAGAPLTLLIYWMYDTMPIFHPSLWNSDPFAAELVAQPPFERVVIGRGATNSKGPQMSQYNALLSIREVAGTLPVNVILVAEGDEERMSIGLRKFVKENTVLLEDADALFRFGGQQYDGRGVLAGSSEGCLFFELETNGARWGRGPARHNIHGGYRRAVDSPVARHVRMLSQLVSEDGNRVLIPGWYDEVSGPSPEEQEHIEKLAAEMDIEAFKASIGVERFIDDMSPVELLTALRYGMSFNTEGIWTGNMAEGVAGSVLPFRIVSKHSCRYPPRVEGADLLARLRAYLDELGYEDVLIRVIGDVPYCKVNYHSPIGRAIMRTYDAWGVSYDVPPAVEMLSAPYWPAYLFGRDPLRMPIAAGGLGHGGRAHSPNEFYVIEGNEHVFGMREAEKAVAMILYNMAEIAT